MQVAIANIAINGYNWSCEFQNCQLNLFHWTCNSTMNLMVHKCEDPTKRNITIYRRSCVHDNEQYYIWALQFILSVAPSANARMIYNWWIQLIIWVVSFLLHCDITFKQLNFGIYNFIFVTVTNIGFAQLEHWPACFIIVNITGLHIDLQNYLCAWRLILLYKMSWFAHHSSQIVFMDREGITLHWIGLNIIFWKCFLCFIHWTVMILKQQPFYISKPID